MGYYLSLKKKMQGHKERSSNPSNGRVGPRSYYPFGSKKRGSYGVKFTGLSA